MRRIPELDGIRGFAAVIVVLYHAFPFAVSWGWVGVDLFFVLSGYLITTIAIDGLGKPGFLRSFYLRRFLRIWPVYFLTLAAVLALNRLSSVGYPTDGLPAHLVFLQNTPAYFGRTPPEFIHSFSPSWSVAIEEQYYLAWPLVLLLIGRSRIPLVCAALLALCVAFRQYLPGTINLLFTRGDGLALGCFLAWLLRKEAGPRPSKLAFFSLVGASLVGGGYVMAYLVAFWGDPHPNWTETCFTGFGLLFFALIGLSVCYSGARVLVPFRNPVLRWFGTVSYALYLFHLPIMHYCPPILDRLGVGSDLIRAVIMWGLIVGLPALSWYFLERPILGLSRGSSGVEHSVGGRMPQPLPGTAN